MVSTKSKAQYQIKETLLLILVVVTLWLWVPQTDANTYITQLAWSPDGLRLAVGYSDGNLEIRDSTGTVITEFLAHDDQITEIAWHPVNSVILATGGQDLTAKVWNLTTQSLVYSPIQHDLAADDAVTNILWSPDGNLLMTASVLTRFSMWITDAQTGTLLVSYVAPGLREGRWRPDMAIVAITGEGGLVRFWNNMFEYSGRFIHPDQPIGFDSVPGIERYASLDTIDWHPDGTFIATGDRLGNVRIWDTTSVIGSQQQMIITPSMSLIGNENKAWMLTVRYNVDGSRLSSVGADGFLKIWESTTGTLLETMQLTDSPYLSDWDPALYAADWNPDRTLLAIASANGLEIVPASASFLSNCDSYVSSIYPQLMATTIETLNVAETNKTLCLTEDATYDLPKLDNDLNALPIITGDITIEGNGATLTRDETADLFRFFEVAPGGSR